MVNEHLETFFFGHTHTSFSLQKKKIPKKIKNVVWRLTRIKRLTPFSTHDQKVHTKKTKASIEPNTNIKIMNGFTVK